METRDNLAYHVHPVCVRFPGGIHAALQRLSAWFPERRGQQDVQHGHVRSRPGSLLGMRGTVRAPDQLVPVPDSRTLQLPGDTTSSMTISSSRFLKSCLIILAVNVVKLLHHEPKNFFDTEIEH